MTLTDDKLETFKASFRQQLADFMQKRANDIGEPSDWRPYYARFKNTMNFTAAKKKISFTVKDIPANLTEQEETILRQAMYDVCAERGFKPVHAQTNNATPTKDAYERMREGDEDAWQEFVVKRSPQHLRYASTYLGSDNHIILEPEDVVTMAHAQLFQTLQNGGLQKNTPPDSSVMRALFQIAAKEQKNRRSRKQPDGVDGDTVPAKAEIDNSLETIKEQFPRILEEARKKMHKKTQHALDIIMENNAGGNPALTREQIGRNFWQKRTQDAAKMVGYRIMHQITAIIQATAHEMGPDYEDAAAIIDWLVKANSKGNTIR